MFRFILIFILFCIQNSIKIATAAGITFSWLINVCSAPLQHNDNLQPWQSICSGPVATIFLAFLLAVFPLALRGLNNCKAHRIFIEINNRRLAIPLAYAVFLALGFSLSVCVC